MVTNPLNNANQKIVDQYDSSAESLEHSKATDSKLWELKTLDRYII